MRRLLVGLALCTAACSAEEPMPEPQPSQVEALASHLVDGGAAVAFRVELPEAPRCRRVVSAWSLRLDERFGPAFVQRGAMAARDRIGGTGEAMVHVVELPVSGTYGLRFLGCRTVAGELVGLEHTLGFAKAQTGVVTHAGVLQLPDLPSAAVTIKVEPADDVSRGALATTLPGSVVRSVPLAGVADVAPDMAGELDALRADIASFAASESAFDDFYDELLSVYRKDKRTFEDMDRRMRAAGREPGAAFQSVYGELTALRTLAAAVPKLQEAELTSAERFAAMRDLASGDGGAPTSDALIDAELRRMGRMEAGIGAKSRERVLALVRKHQPSGSAARPDTSVLDDRFPPLTAGEVKALR